MKASKTTFFLFAGIAASLGSLALAQSAGQKQNKSKRTQRPPVLQKVTPPTPAPVLVEEVAAPAVEVLTPAPVTTPEPTPPTPITDEAARVSLKAGTAASATGDLRQAELAFRTALTLAPPGEPGDAVAWEASKRLGFLAFEKRDPRSAETFFGAEAVLARRLYFSGKISPRAFADSVQRFASATGSMGRSGESAALSFYAQEIKSRAQAEVSSQLLNRDTNDPADSVGNVRVAASGLCVVGRDPLLKDRVSCEDEEGARGEALALQARQIKASAPPPPTKAEREAKEAKNKGKGG
ncbi:hypothetical protein [Aquidulcibacter sp.]|uniref:hypothetical protein n=1 Tax=Aquidulcibacter sp. TaxID=2052990 RepID=UPI0028A61307|nr:hypothetical protein [Aquidulcibacter sp.]